jgi:hypothetical protein
MTVNEQTRRSPDVRTNFLPSRERRLARNGGSTLQESIGRSTYYIMIN